MNIAFVLFQASSQCSYKSSPTVIPKLNNTLGGDIEDGGRPMSPSTQAQAPIKQELVHHMPDFHDNISLPVSNNNTNAICKYKSYR